MEMRASFSSLESVVNNYLSLTTKIKNAITHHSKATKQIESIQSIQSFFPRIENGSMEDISLPKLNKAFKDINDPSIVLSYVSPLLSSIESFRILNYIQEQSAISEQLGAFLLKWSEYKEPSDLIKEINYSNGDKYIGQYTICKDETLFQTITKNKFGILYYKDNNNNNTTTTPDRTNVLIGHFTNDIFTKGLLINNELISIGTFTKTEANQIFNGIIINITNELFLGIKTDSTVEAQSVYKGLIIEIDSKEQNVISFHNITQCEANHQQEGNPIGSSSALIIEREKDKNEYRVTLYTAIDTMTFIYDSRKYLLLYDCTQNSYTAVFYILNEYSLYNGPINYEPSTGKFEVKNQGIVLYSNSDIYYGNVLNEVKQGYGEYFSNEKGYYCKGQYFNDTFIEGEIRKMDNSFKANGLFTDGFAIQKGKVTFSNNDTFEGDFDLNLKYNGKGQYDYSQILSYDNKPVKISYEGYWRNGLKNDKGKLTITPLDKSIKEETFSVNFEYGEFKSID